MFGWRTAPSDPRAMPPPTPPSNVERSTSSSSAPSSSSTSLAPSHAQSSASASGAVASSRSVKQLGLFFAGAGFMLFSTLITRRAVMRKTNAAMPKFYDHTLRPAAKGSSANPEGSLIAFEALNLATLNVFSFMIMATGGLAWAFDVASVEDLRQKARASLYGKDGRTDEAAEAEMEEWMAKVLSRLGRDKGSDSDSKSDKGTGA